jgi:hypothetical protein
MPAIDAEQITVICVGTIATYDGLERFDPCRKWEEAPPLNNFI